MELFNNVKTILIVFVLIMKLTSCKTEEKLHEKKQYNPGQPIKAGSFYPIEGGIATKLIISGENFGSDPSKIRVWYNNKRASIIGSDGNHLYVVTPSQPGNICKISIVVGKDSVTFDQTFTYHTTTTVTTVTGQKGATAFRSGNLASATFVNPQRICIDKQGNIYGAHRNPSMCFMINEKSDIVMQMPNIAPTAGSPTMNLTDKIVTFPDDAGDNYYEFDADLQWAGRRRTILHPGADQIAAGMKNFTIAFKSSFTTNQLDGMIYTWDYNVGALVRFDPGTRIGELVTQFQQGAGSHAMLVFHPIDKHILYIGLVQKNAIYTYDTRTGEFKQFAGVLGVNGWRDGNRLDSYIGEVGQFVFDKDINLIFSDAGNHCIRKISANGQVSTIIGRPKVAGYQDGNPDDALFNYPRGMCIDKDYNIYISDTNNGVIRKLSIQ